MPPLHTKGDNATNVSLTRNLFYGYFTKGQLLTIFIDLKLGLMGATVLYAAGDNGVGGNGGQCIDPATG